jgi:protein-disulfide isomerase
MFRFLPVSLGCVLLGTALIAAETSSTASLPPPVIVEVDGVKLTLADYTSKHPGGLFQAEQQFYTSERKVVEAFTEEYLIDRQAKKEGISINELIDRHIKSRVGKEPSEEALHVYYEGLDTDQPFEAVRQQIIEHIQEVRLAKARADYMKELKKDAKINIIFGPPRAQIAAGNAPVFGTPNAAVKIIEFADYECPYCQTAQPALDKVLAEYKDRVAFVYKDIPLAMHTHAQKAAEAAHCAGDQGKYWEYHDVLFKTKALDLPDLKKHAGELKLDEAAFNKCLDSGAKAEVVKALSYEGQGWGLQGTPSFFINGRFVSGGMTYDQMRTLIEEELALAAARNGKNTAQR